MASDDPVGYGKPPKHSRFKKGQSGNPRGRPKGRRNLTADLIDELNQRVQVTERGRTRLLTKQQIIVKQAIKLCLSGDLKAISRLLPILAALDRDKSLDSNVSDADPPLTNEALVRWAQRLLAKKTRFEKDPS